MFVDVSSVAVNVPVPLPVAAGTSLALFIVALKVTSFVFGPIVTGSVVSSPQATTAIKAAKMASDIPRFCIGPGPRDGLGAEEYAVGPPESRIVPHHATNPRVLRRVPAESLHGLRARSELFRQDFTPAMMATISAAHCGPSHPFAPSSYHS